MSSLLRFAFGTVQPDVDLRAASWALLRLLKQMDFEVQSFGSRSLLTTLDGAHVATGQRARHLDSWTMSPEVCVESLLQGTEHADVAVIEGSYDCAFDGPQGGSLDRLCEWLDLPRLAVVDVRRLRTTGLPKLLAEVDGFFLDGVSSVEELYRYKTDLEAIFQAPVIGSLSQLTGVRTAIHSIPAGTKPPVSLCDALAHSLSAHFWPEALLQAAERAACGVAPSDLFGQFVDLSNHRVAVAYDDAFHSYFPDTLELLEKRGATLVDFSPLRCESVPTDVDVVYFGGGSIEQHAAALSHNCCLRQTLKQHVRQGGLVYAECSAVGYLCEEMVIDDTSHRMVGLLPATAHLQNTTCQPVPTQTTFTQDCWLGNRGDTLRGYHTNRLQFECRPQVETFSRTHAGDPCLIGYGAVLASPMQIHFAAQPERLQRFCRPGSPITSVAR